MGREAGRNTEATGDACAGRYLADDDRAELVQLGTSAADERRHLIEAHMDVARNIARGLSRHYGWILDPDDIDGFAMMGLCEAAAHYDRSRPESFIAFAEVRIRGSVIDEVRRLGMHGRVINKRQRRISTARYAISQAGNEPTDDRVADYLGIALQVVQRATQQHSRAGAEEFAAVPSQDVPADVHIESAQSIAHLATARDALSELDARVIQLHYDAEMSMASVARTLELTIGQVRHAHARALDRLRQAMLDSRA